MGRLASRKVSCIFQVPRGSGASGLYKYAVGISWYIKLYVRIYVSAPGTLSCSWPSCWRQTERCYGCGAGRDALEAGMHWTHLDIYIYVFPNYFNYSIFPSYPFLSHIIPSHAMIKHSLVTGSIWKSHLPHLPHLLSTLSYCRVFLSTVVDTCNSSALLECVRSAGNFLAYSILATCMGLTPRMKTLEGERIIESSAFQPLGYSFSANLQALAQATWLQSSSPS